MNKSTLKSLLSFALVILFIGFVVLWSANVPKRVSKGIVNFHQNYIEALYSKLKLDDIKEVFWRVFSQLDDEVTIYPTENYYYFSFYADGKNIWGNFRLSPEDRDQGILHFAYWEFNENPKSPDDFYSQYKQFTRADGVSVEKIEDLKYKVGYKGKTAIFNLHSLPQEPPKLFKLRDDEVFVARTFDESGFQFFLIFNTTENHFMYVLNEEAGVPDTLEPLDKSILIGKRTGFAFYVDSSISLGRSRKILIGVYAENIKKNNYFDGPFDQLADNYVNENLRLAEFIQRAYPYTKERIDQYGKFTDVDGSRVAISPYYDYYDPQELADILEDCRKETGARFYSCLTYDVKEF